MTENTHILQEISQLIRQRGVHTNLEAEWHSGNEFVIATYREGQRWHKIWIEADKFVIVLPSVLGGNGDRWEEDRWEEDMADPDSIDKIIDRVALSESARARDPISHIQEGTRP